MLRMVIEAVSKPLRCWIVGHVDPIAHNVPGTTLWTIVCRRCGAHRSEPRLVPGRRWQAR